MADNLATIRAFQNLETNQTSLVKQVRDDNDKYLRATQATSQATQSEVRMTEDQLKQADKRVGDIWANTRKHIIGATQTVMGFLAAASYNGSFITVYSPEVDGNAGNRSGPGGELLSIPVDPNDSNNNPRFQQVIDGFPIGLGKPNPFQEKWNAMFSGLISFTLLPYDENSMISRRSRSVAAETTNVAAGSPYVSLLNFGVQMVKSETKAIHYAGIGVVVAVLAITIAALDQIARADSDQYVAQAGVGRSALSWLTQRVSRSINPVRGNNNVKDPDIWSPLWDGNTASQYDGDPLWPPPSQSVPPTPDTPTAARYMQDGF